MPEAAMVEVQPLASASIQVVIERVGSGCTTAMTPLESPETLEIVIVVDCVPDVIVVDANPALGSAITTVEPWVVTKLEDAESIYCVVVTYEVVRDEDAVVTIPAEVEVRVWVSTTDNTSEDDVVAEDELDVTMDDELDGNTEELNVCTDDELDQTTEELDVCINDELDEASDDELDVCADDELDQTTEELDVWIDDEIVETSDDELDVTTDDELDVMTEDKFDVADDELE